MSENGTQPLLKLDGVTKVFLTDEVETHALADVHMEIEKGEYVSIAGPSGCGKSTLLSILGLLDSPSEGEYLLNGRPDATLAASERARGRNREIGFIFQTFNLVPTLSAAENVESALIPLGIRPPERHRRVAAALESVGLSDRARHLPSELSGGQQQRVAIARALVKQPRALLADEPTGNLDEDTRDEITALLERLWRGLGLTLVLVTHDSAVAGRAQRVAILNKGRLSIRQDTRRAANQT